jgi:hypothetical protein
MVTRNERAMIIELAKAISQLNSALTLMAPEIQERARREQADIHIKASSEGILEVISLIDAEWLPK